MAMMKVVDPHSQVLYGFHVHRQVNQFLAGLSSQLVWQAGEKIGLLVAG